MTRVRVHNFTISLDGYGAGPRQTREEPLGAGEHLLYGLDLTALGYECTTHVPTAAATHVVLTKRR